MTRQKKLWIVVVMAVLMAGGAFLGSRQGETEETKVVAPLAVNTQRAQVSEKQQGLRLTGTVEGLTSAIISSRYSGQVAPTARSWETMCGWWRTGSARRR